jgi:hypothetical protein
MLDLEDSFTCYDPDCPVCRKKEKFLILFMVIQNTLDFGMGEDKYLVVANIEISRLYHSIEEIQKPRFPGYAIELSPIYDMVFSFASIEKYITATDNMLAEELRTFIDDYEQDCTKIIKVLQTENCLLSPRLWEQPGRITCFNMSKDGSMPPGLVYSYRNSMYWDLRKFITVRCEEGNFLLTPWAV